MAERTKVFVSYSHDSPEHAKRVLDLADALRHGGLRSSSINTSTPLLTRAGRAGWIRVSLR